MINKLSSQAWSELAKIDSKIFELYTELIDKQSEGEFLSDQEQELISNMKGIYTLVAEKVTGEARLSGEINKDEASEWIRAFLKGMCPTKEDIEEERSKVNILCPV